MPAAHIFSGARSTSPGGGAAAAEAPAWRLQPAAKTAARARKRRNKRVDGKRDEQPSTAMGTSSTSAGRGPARNAQAQKLPAAELRADKERRRKHQELVKIRPGPAGASDSPRGDPIGDL